MRYSVYGDDFQILLIELAPGEEILAEAGAMVYMTDNVKMEAKFSGGLKGVIKRALVRESIALVSYTPLGGIGYVAFSLPFPGKIVAYDVTNTPIILQKDAFIAMQPTVQFDIAFQKKLGAILFGGEGLILEKFSGHGIVFFGAAGQIVEMYLQPGQVLKVSTGKVVGWEASVEYDIQRAGDIKTMLFGGEGIFVTTLRGPGRVWIQSTSLREIAASLLPYMPEGNTSRRSGFLKI